MHQKNNLMNIPKILNSRDFFVRLNILEADGLIIYDSDRSVRIAISTEFIEMIAYTVTIHPFSEIQLLIIFGLFIRNWNNDIYQNQNVDNAECLNIQSRLVGLIAHDSSSQLQQFLLHQPPNTIGGFINFNIEDDRIEIKTWQDQINLDDCSSGTIKKNHHQVIESKEKLTEKEYQNKKVVVLKNHIRKFIYRLAFRKKVFEHDLFYFQIKNLNNRQQLINKIFFKLKRILNKKFANDNAKIYFNLLADGKILKSSFCLPLRILIIFKNEEIISWDQDFVWIDYSLDKYNFHEKNLIKEAENILLNVSKITFSNFENCLGQNLLNFIQGKLQTLSLDLLVRPRWANMYLSLNEVDFKTHVYLDNNWIFDAEIDEKVTWINYYGKGIDRGNVNKKNVSEDLLDNSQIDSHLEMVVSKMNHELGNVWSENDTIGDVVKSANFILYKLFTPKIFNQICIETNRTIDTKLKDIYNENQNATFAWVTLTFTSQLAFNNQGFKFLEIKKINFVEEIKKAISAISLKNVFLQTGENLFFIMDQELNNIDYNFSIKTKYKNLHSKITEGDFYFHIYYATKWLLDVQLYLPFKGKKWFLFFFSERPNETLDVKNDF